MWLQISCICLYSLQCVFCCDISWATVPVEKLHWVHLWAQATGSGIQDDNSRGENWVYTLHWEQLWRRNDRGPLSEDVGRLVQWNYVPVWRNLKSRWVEHCKYPDKFPCFINTERWHFYIFFIVYIGQLGLWAQGFGKMDPKWQFMGQQWEDSFCPICGWCASMRNGRYIRIANLSNFP